MEAKLRQLAGLMQSDREIGWSQSLDEEDDAVRAMWMALRRAKLGNAYGQTNLLDEFNRLLIRTRRTTA